MVSKSIPTTGGDTIVITEDKPKTNFASKGLVNGLAIPALAASGIALLKSGALGGIIGGGNGCASGGGAPANEITAKEAYMEEAADAVALTAAIYQNRITNLQEMHDARNTDVTEKFGLYKSQTEGDFALYKSGRDADDALGTRISHLECKVDVANATLQEREKARERERALEYALINAKMEANAKQAGFDLATRTCRMIQGELVLPNKPTVTGYPSQPYCQQE